MKARILFAAFFAAFITFPAAQAFNVRLEPDPRLDKSLFGVSEMDGEPFARACLLASGADSEAASQHAARLENLWQELSFNLGGTESVEEKADKILMFIYEKLLSKYDFYQTRVDLAMESGVYNCVSSAVLFMFFCKKAGIPVVANECPRHAFCSVFDGPDKIDVETTNPYGVNPGKKRGAALGNGKTQWITVPAKDYVGRHQVDDRRVVAMIYCNRISALQKKKLDDQTVGLAVDAYEVQGHSPVSKNDLEACVGNASAILTRAGREDEAIGFLKKVEEIFGPSDNWTKRINTNYYNLVLGKINRGPFDEALAQVEANRQNLSEKDFKELKEYAYLTGAQERAKRMDWREAVRISQEGLAEFPQSKKLLNNKNVYAQNLAIDFHNAAVDLFNAGKKDAAAAKIRAGLEEVPGNKILLNDLNRMAK